MDQNRLPPSTKPKPSILNANRSTEGYLNPETRVTPTRSVGDDMVDRFSLPNTEESKRHRGKMAGEIRFGHQSNDLRRSQEDFHKVKEEEKGLGESKRVSFYEGTDIFGLGDETGSQERKSLQNRRPKLLNKPSEEGEEASLPKEDMKVIDVFKHYDKLATELKELYSSKMQAVREEVRRETEKATKERMLREEVDTSRKKLEDEVRYYKEELEEERKKALERNAELRKLRREKITAHRSETERGTSESKRAEFGQGDELLVKCKDLENQVKILESTLTQVSKERDLLKDEMLHLQANANQTQTQLIASSAIREELSYVLKDIQKDRVEMTILLQNLAQNKETISTLSLKNEELYEKLKYSEEENHKLSEALNEISGDVASVPILKKQSQDLVDALAHKDEKLRTLTSKSEGLEKQLAVYKDKVDTLLGLNDFMEKNLKDAEEKGKRSFHDKNDEVDSMKERIQHMIAENLKLKKKINELEGQLDLVEVEASQARKREEELTEQTSILHEDLMTVSNQLSTMEVSYDRMKKEHQAFKNVIEQLEDEAEASKNHEEKAVRAIKAYEILLTDIASKIQAAGGPSLKVPLVDLERFDDTQQRDQFMALLCSFEDGVKVVLDRQKRPASTSENRLIADFNKQASKKDAAVNAEVVEKLKSMIVSLLSMLEDIADDPDKVGELLELLQEYCETKINLGNQEERLLEKELQLNNASVILLYLGQIREDPTLQRGQFHEIFAPVDRGQT